LPTINILQPAPFILREVNLANDQHTTASAVYLKGGKSCQGYINNNAENLFHGYSPCGKLFQTGLVPVARYGNPLPRLSINK
jgi:hypothetical protein